MTFILMLESLRVGGGGCIWIITSALVLFLSFEIEIGDGPGPELDNSEICQLLGEDKWYPAFL